MSREQVTETHEVSRTRVVCDTCDKEIRDWVRRCPICERDSCKPCRKKAPWKWAILGSGDGDEDWICPRCFASPHRARIIEIRERFFRETEAELDAWKKEMRDA